MLHDLMSIYRVSKKTISTVKILGEAIRHDMPSDRMGLKLHLFEMFTRFSLMPSVQFLCAVSLV